MILKKTAYDKRKRLYIYNNSNYINKVKKFQKNI